MISFKAMLIASIYSRLIDPLLWDIRVYLPHFAQMKTGERVLDVCCGTGDQALHYARRGIVSNGIDQNPGMIEAARKRQRKYGLEKVSFEIADALYLPFKDGFFDYTSISFGLHEKERTARDRIVSEMKRVTKKEGALIFIDFEVPSPRNRYRYLIKAIEFVAGKNHYRCFKDYLEQGGLDEILSKNQLRPDKKDYLKNGLVTIIETKNV